MVQTFFPLLQALTLGGTQRKQHLLTGGLVMRLVGKDSGPGTPWLGKWIILKGTGDLNGITGQGSWSATGGVISYSGFLHYKPG